MPRPVTNRLRRSWTTSTDGSIKAKVSPVKFLGRDADFPTARLRGAVGLDQPILNAGLSRYAIGRVWVIGSSRLLPQR